jgi:hypothetical protein
MAPRIREAHWRSLTQITYLFGSFVPKCPGFFVDQIKAALSDLTVLVFQSIHKTAIREASELHVRFLLQERIEHTATPDFIGEVLNNHGICAERRPNMMRYADVYRQ